MSEPRRSFFRRHRWLVWTGSVLALVCIAAVVAGIVIARRIEPFLRAQVIAALAERLHARVELDRFHVALDTGVGGRWGIVAEGRGLRIWPSQPQEPAATPAPSAPFIQLDEFDFRAPLRYDAKKPIVLARVHLSGLAVHVPPRSQRPPGALAPPPQPSTNSVFARVVIERIDCDHAELTLASNKPDKLPLGFAIQQLRLTHLAVGQPVGFEAQLINPRPVGVIHTAGRFGPWLLADPGASPVTGTYQFDRANLAIFRGISGTLRSTGSFAGTLRDLTVDGEAHVPDFELERFSSPLPLDTRFHARVDGTSGDTWLDSVQATLGRAHFTTSGRVVRMRTVLANGGAAPVAPTQHAAFLTVGGHDILLDIHMRQQRIDDFLRFTSQQQQQLLTGIISLDARLHLPPGQDKVVRRLALDGSFDLEQAQFTSDKIQSKVDELSLRGQGRPGDVNRPQSAGIDSAMHAHFSLAHAVVTLPDLDYSVPGAHILLKGTYGLEGGALSFAGTARMDATVSQMVGGWKGLLLKPADRFFRKDGAGTLVPIHVAGTREAPKFGVDLPALKGAGTHPQRPDAPNAPVN